MWKAALIRALTILVPVAALSVWGWQVLQGALVQAAEGQSRTLAAQVQGEIQRAMAEVERDLSLLCRFDRRTERLVMEIRGGLAQGDVIRSLIALANTTQLERLSLRRTEDGSLIAWTPAKPAPDSSPPSSRSAARSEADEKGTGLWLHARCQLGASLELAASRHFDPAQHLPEAVSLQIGSPPGAKQGPSEASRAWPPQGEAGPEVWLQSRATERPLAAFEAGAALCLVLALGLALFSLRAGEPHGRAEITALTAIEQAAARVARGDLVSHIGVRTGTQVDRTLTAFDRMTEELRATREKLVKAERAGAWQDMARRIAHEIKNPLSPIRTAMENLRKAHGRRHPDFDEIFEESSQAILEEVERLQRIVREFSEFARLPKPRPGAIDLSDTASHAVTVVKHGDVAVKLVAALPLPSVRADREQLTQVLLNLLQNACTAAAAARGPEALVELRLVAGAQHVRLEVHDNGPGVPAGKRAQIFEPYFTQSQGGSGLGLTIAARIVEEHEAHLAVDDSPLGGACFAFALPIEDSGLDTSPTRPERPRA